MEQLDILVFGAHPDDAEIGMGGTIAKHTAAGYKIGICDLTEAEMSSNGTVELRQQEAALASAVLGLSARSCLKLPDRGLRLESSFIDPIVEKIRQHRPRIVCAPYWEDRHPDHIMCSKLVEEAVFNAKLRRYMTHLPAWQVEQTLFYYINDVHNISLMIDISEVQQQKERALRAYASQFNTAATADGVATPLTNGYIERVNARDTLLGQPKGWQYAEGFAVKGPYPVDKL